MRQAFCAGMLIGLLTCTGCLTKWNADQEVKTPPAPVTTKAPPLVRPDQITPENGHQVCDALEAELAWEFQQRMLTSR